MPGEPLVGLHVSISGSIDLAFDRALEIGANTLQIFTRNPNRWKFTPIPDEVAATFNRKRKASGFRLTVAHMPYLPNLSSPLRPMMKISRHSLNEEVKRCDTLGIDYLVVHLGSHLGSGVAVGMRNVAEACKAALAGRSGKTSILLENMAGQRNSVGSRFEELKDILNQVDADSRMGVCLDSCHAFAAGFDLGGREAVDNTMGLFEDLVGMDRLKVVHLNDSRGVLGSRLDRHELIGEGMIGAKGMRALLHHPGIMGLPLIMETPYEDTSDMKRSISIVRKLLK